jgi:phospholipid/cholesterol/gamma-HCH transport system ATP-binding protein
LTKPTYIEITDLRKSINGQEILKGVNLDVSVGEILVIIGPSGTGKSVLLKNILGLIPPDSGSIKIAGQEITKLNERELAPIRRAIGMLFQNGALFDSMTVEENVAFPLIELKIRDSKEIERRVLENLSLVGLADHTKKMPVALSGGMKKRVAMARAMITRPACILYDEPTSGLDPLASDSINHQIRRLRRDFKITSIVVTHDMTSAYHIADRIAYLKGGAVRFIGTPDEVKASSDPDLQDFIHGRSGEES